MSIYVYGQDLKPEVIGLDKTVKEVHWSKNDEKVDKIVDEKKVDEKVDKVDEKKGNEATTSTRQGKGAIYVNII